MWSTKASSALSTVLPNHDNFQLLTRCNNETNPIAWTDTLSLLIGLSTVIFRLTVRPIRLVISKLKDIAESGGDLTNWLDVTSNDEIGELATAFNTFVQKTQNSISQVNDNARKMGN